MSAARTSYQPVLYHHVLALDWDVTEAFIQSDGGQLWTATQGSGVLLLLCNGGPGCCDYLAPVVSMLDDLAYVVRFEARGCGRSEAAPTYDVEGAVGDL